MSYFRKMVMLSYDEFIKYKNLLYTSQVTPEVNPLQNELNAIKDNYGTNLPDDQRVKLESEVIQKYSNKIPDKESKPIQIDQTQIKWIKNAIENFSKTNKARASRLYEYLLNRVQDRWNENGELLTVDGEVIRGSNILDLINFVTTSNIKQHEQIPFGFTEFKTMINNANVPLHMFSKNGLEYIYSNTDADVDDENKQASYIDYSTPRSSSFKDTPKHRGKRYFKWDNYE